MTVKTGSAWAGLFVTLDATGAASAADSAPTGTLYVDGVSNAASVTITGSNPYKFAVTLPTLTAGQRVDMYITATIDTIATAGIVASAQADTVLLSDGVTLADDAITAGKFDESTAYPLKSADTGATQVARVGADSDTLETLSDQLDVVQTDLDNPAQYKADVSGLALEATLTAIKGAGWTTETLVTLKAYVDEIETRLTAVRAGYLDKLNVTGTLAHSDAAATYKADVSGLAPANEYDARMTALQADLDNPDQYKADVSGLATSAEVGAIDTDTIMSFMIDGFTFEQIVQIMASVLAGKLTRSGDTLTFRDLADTVNRVVVETDENKQRTGMTYTV